MLKSSKMYSINRLTIDKDLKKNIFLPNIEVRKALSNVLRVHAKEKTSFNLNLKNYRERYCDIIVPFKKPKRCFS